MDAEVTEGHSGNVEDNSSNSTDSIINDKVAEVLPNMEESIANESCNSDIIELEELLTNTTRQEGKALTLNSYDKERTSHAILPTSTRVEASMKDLTPTISCDICHDVITNSVMTKKCGHRFCDQCILLSLMRAGSTCPSCRTTLSSKRELKQDPRFDTIISQLLNSRSDFSNFSTNETDMLSKEGDDRWDNKSVEYDEKNDELPQNHKTAKSKSPTPESRNTNSQKEDKKEDGHRFKVHEGILFDDCDDLLFNRSYSSDEGKSDSDQNNTVSTIQQGSKSTSDTDYKNSTTVEGVDSSKELKHVLNEYMKSLSQSNDTVQKYSVGQNWLEASNFDSLKNYAPNIFGKNLNQNDFCDLNASTSDTSFSKSSIENLEDNIDSELTLNDAEEGTSKEVVNTNCTCNSNGSPNIFILQEEQSCSSDNEIEDHFIEEFEDSPSCSNELDSINDDLKESVKYLTSDRMDKIVDEEVAWQDFRRKCWDVDSQGNDGIEVNSNDDEEVNWCICEILCEPSFQAVESIDNVPEKDLLEVKLCLAKLIFFVEEEMDMDILNEDVNSDITDNYSEQSCSDIDDDPDAELFKSFSKFCEVNLEDVPSIEMITDFLAKNEASIKPKDISKFTEESTVSCMNNKDALLSTDAFLADETNAISHFDDKLIKWTKHKRDEYQTSSYNSFLNSTESRPIEQNDITPLDSLHLNIAQALLSVRPNDDENGENPTDEGGDEIDSLVKSKNGAAGVKFSPFGNEVESNTNDKISMKVDSRFDADEFLLTDIDLINDTIPIKLIDPIDEDDLDTSIFEPKIPSQLMEKYRSFKLELEKKKFREFSEREDANQAKYNKKRSIVPPSSDKPISINNEVITQGMDAKKFKSAVSEPQTATKEPNESKNPFRIEANSLIGESRKELDATQNNTIPNRIENINVKEEIIMTDNTQKLLPQNRDRPEPLNSENNFNNSGLFRNEAIQPGTTITPINQLHNYFANFNNLNIYGNGVYPIINTPSLQQKPEGVNDFKKLQEMFYNNSNYSPDLFLNQAGSWNPNWNMYQAQLGLNMQYMQNMQNIQNMQRMSDGNIQNQAMMPNYFNFQPNPLIPNTNFNFPMVPVDNNIKTNLLNSPFTRNNPIEKKQEKSPSNNDFKVKLEVEMWPTNGLYSKMKRIGISIDTLFCGVSGNATFYHIAQLLSSRYPQYHSCLLSNFWAYRKHNRSLRRFSLHHSLVEAQRFVGGQHLIIFYDEAVHDLELSQEYIVNNLFNPMLS